MQKEGASESIEDFPEDSGTRIVVDPVALTNRVIPNSSHAKHLNDGTEEADTSLCPICLEQFKNGDDICCSRNLECGHVFHLSCITSWLMTHDDCPLCRADYFELDSKT